MRQLNSVTHHTAFNVEKNAQFALQVLNAYYLTPDPTGKSYAAFPDFFLIDPKLLDLKQLSIHSQEKKLLRECQERALQRNGYIGITKYYDEKFGYHWIKLSVFPFRLGDEVDEKKSEFFYVINKFVEFSKKNPGVYGDVTAECEIDQDIALMLREIRKTAELLNEKIKFYPIEMLVAFDPLWPAAEVKKLLVTLESSEQSWDQLFLEYLHDVLRQKNDLTLPPKLQTLNMTAEIAKKIRDGEAIALGEKPGSDTQNEWLDTVVIARTHKPETAHRIPASENPVLQAAQENIQAAIHPGDVATDTAVQPRAPVQEAERLLSLAKLRAEKLAELKIEATQKAVQAEEEKIRLEALAIVAARNQITAAEAASQAARERIEQTQKMRIADEAKIQEWEREHLRNEELAALAVKQREAAAEQVMQEAAQRQLLEQQLLESEQHKLAQERELKLQITQRMAAFNQTNALIQARIQNEHKSAQLAQDKLAAEQMAAAQAEERVRQVLIEEAKARELEHEHLHNQELALLAVKQREEVAERAKQEAEQRRVLEEVLIKQEQQNLEQERELKLQITQRMAAYDQANVEMQARIQREHEAAQLAQGKIAAEQAATLQAEQHIRQLKSQAVAEQKTSALHGTSYDPFAYEEKLSAEQNMHKLSDGNELHTHLNAKESLSVPVFKQKRIAAPAMVLGLISLVVLAGVLLFKWTLPESTVVTQAEPPKPIVYGTGTVKKIAVPDTKPAVEPETAKHEAETVMMFNQLKMSDHLQMKESH